jgi:hypothetical protein
MASLSDAHELREDRLLRLVANRNASRHTREDGHPIARSAGPGEDWSWCYVDEPEFVVVSPVKEGS